MSSILDDLFITDIKAAIRKLHRRCTWKDCRKELPGESGVYLVKCLSPLNGKAYMVNCCLFDGNEWKTGHIPGVHIDYWCEMPENEVHI